MLGQIYRRLLEINESGRTAVLLIDEVQMLKSREIMEEFRGLLNMEMPAGKMINLILFGLPDLEEVLSLDEPLKQRVAMRVVLRPLSEDNAIDYVRHIHVAGGEQTLFLDDALREIYRYSKGIPRLINTICDNALLEGYLFRAKNIDTSIIKTVAIDLGLNSESSTDSK